MDASDLIKTLQNTLQGGGRPHMGNRCDRELSDAITQETVASNSNSNIAIEYFKEAVAYHISADRLYEQIDSQTLQKFPLRDPIYFLYHHAVELALKACLLSHGLSVRSGHSIGAFFKRCRTKGFLGIDDEHREMQGLVVFLDATDNGQGYRYAGQNDFRPDLPWVQEVVGTLIAAVEPHVETWAKKNGIAGPSEPYSATKLWHFFGKPTYTKQPRPLKPGP